MSFFKNLFRPSFDKAQEVRAMLSAFRRRARAVALVVLLVVAAGALLQGSPVTLTFQGTGTGSVTPAGSTTPVPFSNSAFTFSFTTDTTMISASGAIFNTPFVTGGTVSIGGMSGTFSIPVSAQVNSPFVNFIVKLTSSSTTSVVGGSSTSFATYNLQSAIGPLTLSAADVNASHPSVPTSFGSFVLTGVNSETFTAAITTSVPGGPPPRANLVAFYPFNGNANDASGNGKNGTINGSPTFTNNGPFGGSAITFAGDDAGTKNDFVTVPIDTSIENSPKETFGAWFLVSSGASTCCIRGLISSDDGGFDPTLDIDTRNGGFQYTAFVGSGPVSNGTANTGQWIFVAVSYDNTAQTYIFQVGNSQVTGTTAFDGNGVEGTTYIGINPNFDFEFNGEVADAFFYNTALSASQLNAIAQGGPNAILGLQPSIKAGGIVSASAFGEFAAAAPGSWIEIYGPNLASDSRSWASSDFNGVNAPTSLDGTRVTIGGQAAFIDYISSGQVNAQVPSNVAPGPQQVIVTTAVGSSAPVTLTINPTEPGLLAPASFNIGGKQYVAALFPDGVTFVLPPGAISGVNSQRAKPSDTIILYGVGFGGVTPPIPAGQITVGSNQLTASLQISFGGTAGQLTYWGLAPSFVGLYQFNVMVPNVAPSDTVPLTFTLGGVRGSQTLYIAVQN